MIDVITGASGLLGYNLAKFLLESTNHRIRILIRDASQIGLLMEHDDSSSSSSRVEYVVGDITNKEDIKRLLDNGKLRISRLFHVAGVVSMWNGDFDMIRKVNVEGVRNLLQVCREMMGSVSVIVHISSVDALPLNSNANNWKVELDESSNGKGEWNWDVLGVENAYARSKRDAEIIIRETLADGSFPSRVVIVNPCFILGRRPKTGKGRRTSDELVYQIANVMILPVYLGGGNNFVHVQDVVDAMIAAASKGINGKNYIIGGKNMTYYDFNCLVCEVCNIRKPFIPLPFSLARIGGWGGDLWGALTKRDPGVCSTSVKLGWLHHYYSDTESRKELGMDPKCRDVADGVRHVLLLSDALS